MATDAHRHGEDRTIAARTAWATMSQLFMQSAGRMEGIATSLGLTPTDMKALLHLDPDQTPSQGELAEHWRCDASWVTAKVDGLEASGLVARVPDPRDRRRKTVVLTAEGQRAQAAALERLYDPPEQLTALDDDDLHTLARVLAKVDLGEDTATHGPLRFLARRGGPSGVGPTARAEHVRPAP